MKIDFTTTAMPRPDIFDRCLSSFDKNLTGINLRDCNLYINVDPLPNENEKELIEIERLRLAVVSVAKKYFKNVVHRFPENGNYADAYKWLWGKAESDVIFNLEDDWTLNKPVCVNNLLRKFDNNTLYQVVFRAYNYVYPTCCTSPSFVHRRWYSHISKGIRTDQNPESQIHKNTDCRFDVFVPNKKTCNSKKIPGEKREIEKYICAYPKYRLVPGNIIVDDIGRKWIEESPYSSPVEKYKIMYKKYVRHCELNNLPIRAPKKWKKVSFLSWVIKDGVHPLKWLKDYKYE